MKRFLLASLAGIILLAIPATASASTGGAARAVHREVCFDYECQEDIGDIYNVDPSCHAKGHGYYTCSIYALEAGGHYNLIRGKARVTQIGSRYFINYRLHW
jgi:hypothetical protein